MGGVRGKEQARELGRVERANFQGKIEYKLHRATQPPCAEHSHLSASVRVSTCTSISDK